MSTAAQPTSGLYTIEFKNRGKRKRTVTGMFVPPATGVAGRIAHERECDLEESGSVVTLGGAGSPLVEVP